MLWVISAESGSRVVYDPAWFSGREYDDRDDYCYDYCDEDCDWAKEREWYDKSYKYYANRS